MARIWDPFLTARDREVFAASGYAAPVGFGQRPALMIVDVSYNFCGDRPEPLLESIKKWRNSCGEDAWQAIAVIRRLLDACHAKGLPVFYSTNTRRPDGFDAGSWRWKNARELEDAEKEIAGNAIVKEIAPASQDVVILKTKPSVFFGTPLLSFLIDLRVDTLMVCGVSTSGCVRATVVDAFSNNLRVQVIEDACFDRSQASHAVNLADLNAKYADVIPSADALAAIASYPDGLFDLPTGVPTRASQGA
ncbi:MAG TPA: isochorismatase family protein [Beijerinckiaceae bacterium]|jgi:nicotinamidase-related amidase